MEENPKECGLDFMLHTLNYDLHYNDSVQSYQKDIGGFPASVLGKLFGIQEVELFA